MEIIDSYKSPNFSKRTENIEYVILHYTEMTFDGALEKLCDSKAGVSAHYLIKKSGEIFQLVEDKHVAWHAGVSCWNGKEYLNNNSIGIEIDNLGDEEFSLKQVQSCIELCNNLKYKHQIKAKNFIAHSDIAPSRKVDPGHFMNWREIADHDIGVWHNLSYRESKILYNFDDQNANIRNIQKQLQKLGYKIEITGKFDQQTNYVIRAFLLKFVPEYFSNLSLKEIQSEHTKFNWTIFAQECLDAIM